MAQTIKLRRGGLGKLATTTAATLTTAQGEVLLGTGSLASGQLSGPVLFAASEDNALQPIAGRIPTVTDGPGLAAAINASGDENFAGLTIHSGSKFYQYVNVGTGFSALEVNAGALDLVDATLNVDESSIVFITGSATGDVTRKESVTDFIAAIAGPGLTATAGVLSTGEGVVSASTSQPGADGELAIFEGANGIEGSAKLKFNGTDLLLGDGVDPIKVLWSNGGYIQSATSNTLTAVGSTKIEIESPSVEIGNVGDTTATTVNIGNSDNSATVNIKGDLNVAGTTTTVNSTTVEIGDNIIVLNTAQAAGDAGLVVHEATNGQSGSLLWDTSNNWWKAGLSTDDEGSGTKYRLAEYYNNDSPGAAGQLMMVNSDGRLTGSAIVDDGTDITFNNNVDFSNITVTFGDSATLIDGGTF